MLYLIATYDGEIPKTIIKEGSYGEDRCGGSISIYVTEQEVRDFIFCIEFNNEENIIVFESYEDNDIFRKYINDNVI